MKLFLLLFLGAVSADPDSFITNGKEAKIEDFPYQARIMVNSSLYGGAIISSRYILTGASCYSDNLKEISVFVGSAKNDEGRRVQIRSIICHPKYDREQKINYIGLVKTERIYFTDKVQSIALPNEDDLNKSFALEDAIVSGWGRIETNGPQSPVLLYADVKIFKQKDCKNRYRGALIKETHMCAVGKGGASACYNDHGGPLVLKSSGILIGITAIVTKGDCRYGAIFTRVTKYRDWILENSGV